MINELIQDITFIGTSAPVAPVLYPVRTAAGHAFKASHVLLKNDAAVTMRCRLRSASTRSAVRSALAAAFCEVMGITLAESGTSHPLMCRLEPTGSQVPLS